MIVWRGTLPALIYPGGQGYMKSPSRVQLDPTATQSGSFLCTTASSTHIRAVTKEVRYIHDLSLTLEHSMPISSPAAPGLTVASLVGVNFGNKSCVSRFISFILVLIDLELSLT